MIKNPTAKYWKQTHHSRKNSTDELNDSGISNHSSLSSGYNRFKFQPREGSVQKKDSIFQYTARNKDKPCDISQLSKRSDKVVSRKSLDVQIPVRDSFIRLDSYREQPATQRVNNKPVRDLAKELKFLTNTLKRAVEYFAKQLRELKLEWDTSIQQLLRHQVSFENTAISQLRETLQQKEKEIERFRLDFANVDKKKPQKESVIKMRHAQSHTEERSLFKLAISQIEPTKTNEAEHQLSRNNTLNSLLGEQKSTPSSRVVDCARDKRELVALKQAISRMREALDVRE